MGLHIAFPAPRLAVGRAVVAIVVIVVIILAGGAAYFLSRPGPTTSTTSSTSSTSSSSATTSSTSTTSVTSASTPQSITYETLQTVQYLDPEVSYDIYGGSVEQNVYEPLLWFNGTNSIDVVPWLAQSFHVSQDGKTMNITLRSGIHFADGETLNSTDVYFSYNRLLISDGSSTFSHGTQPAWIVQQLLNWTLSSNLCLCQHTPGAGHTKPFYGPDYTNAVLGENFVQITGPLSVTLHIMRPQASLPYLLANLWGMMLAPGWTMQHDLALWKAATPSYNLPYSTLSGNITQQIHQYYDDYMATCLGAGCAPTSLEQPATGAMAGTGPYTIQSFDSSTQTVVLKANPNYWGGPSGKIMAHIPTVIYKYVPDQTTREIDLQNAAKTSGQAMVIDVATTNIYDVASKTAWLNNHTLSSIISGVALYGPYTQYASYFIPLDMNVTNPFTGTFYSFQPFADLRIRQAFGDSVDMNAINQAYNNNLGQVANEIVPPGIPPAGAYNSSQPSGFSYNPDTAANLLLAAMQHPVTTFHLENGTVAHPGTFNNSFGCLTLNAQTGKCDHPTPQSVPLVYATGDTVDEQILNSIAGTINNISLSYNMGLTVQVTPVPCGQMDNQAFAGQVYAWAESCFGWFDDYPWSMDFLGPILAPGGIYTAPGGWNIGSLGTLWLQAQQANGAGNLAGVVSATNQMEAIASKAAIDIPTFYPLLYVVMTSNVHGYLFNPSIYTTGEPQYFAALY